MTPRPHGLTRYKRGPDEQGAPGGGCRCDACSQANRDYQDRRTRLIAYGRWDVLSDAAGTRRRLQALVRGGWSLGLMSARLGCTRQVLRLTLHRSERVTAATARAVRELYDELWDQPPPEGTRFEKRAATMARRYARERGWVPPLAWDDDEIDDPAAVPAPGWCPVPADLAASRRYPRGPRLAARGRDVRCDPAGPRAGRAVPVPARRDHGGFAVLRADVGEGQADTGRGEVGPAGAGSRAARDCPGGRGGNRSSDGRVRCRLAAP